MQGLKIEELCNQALKHYLEISDKATHYNSLIPKALAFYKQHHTETVKELPKKDLPNRCGTVVGGLGVEMLRQIILEELSEENKKKIVQWFEFTICGAELIVADGVGPE